MLLTLLFMVFITGLAFGALIGYTAGRVVNESKR